MKPKTNTNKIYEYLWEFEKMLLYFGMGMLFTYTYLKLRGFI